MTAFIANTNILELIGLKSNLNGEFINDANVTVTIKDKAGTEIASEAAMLYVATSNGDYRATISHELEFDPNEFYFAHITADGGTNRIGSWQFRFRTEIRR